MKEEKLFKNVILSNIYQILILIVPFITAPYISRVLGADGVGIYSYVYSLQTYFTMFASLGTATYGMREIARYRNDEKKRSYIFWEIEILTVITTLICLLIWSILSVIYAEYRKYLIALTPCIIAVIFDISWFYTGMEKIKHIVLQNSIFKILSVIMLFIFVKKPDDICIYIAIMSFSILFGNITMWIYLHKYIVSIDFRKLKLSIHFKETLVYFIPTIATSLYTVLDKTLIGFITHSNYENGCYEQATKIINMAKTVSFTAFNNILSSRISFLFSENKKEEIKNRLKESMNLIMLIGIGFVFGIIGISKNFVPLFFGSGYEKTIGILQLMSPLVVIVGVSSCLGAQYYTPVGLRRQSTKYIIIGSVINLIFNIILIPIFTSYGAVIGSIVAETVISSLYLNNCKYYNWLDFLKAAWKKVISGLIMSILIIFIGNCFNNAFLGFTMQVISGVIIYIILLVVLKDNMILKCINFVKFKFCN